MNLTFIESGLTNLASDDTTIIVLVVLIVIGIVAVRYLQGINY